MTAEGKGWVWLVADKHRLVYSTARDSIECVWTVMSVSNRTDNIEVLCPEDIPQPHIATHVGWHQSIVCISGFDYLLFNKMVHPLKLLYQTIASQGNEVTKHCGHAKYGTADALDWSLNVAHGYSVPCLLFSMRQNVFILDGRSFWRVC